eukprot:5653899-Amphidinium_carterae.1
MSEILTTRQMHHASEDVNLVLLPKQWAKLDGSSLQRRVELLCRVFFTVNVEVSKTMQSTTATT